MFIFFAMMFHVNLLTWFSVVNGVKYPDPEPGREAGNRGSAFLLRPLQTGPVRTVSRTQAEFLRVPSQAEMERLDAIGKHVQRASHARVCGQNG